MKLLSTFLSLLFIVVTARAAVFTNTFSADAFVRVNAPTSNYGGAGSLSVSGSTATNAAGSTVNGPSDSFIRFNTAAMNASFDSTFGINNWMIARVKLRVIETSAPMNTVFNRGTGSFEIRWIANDDWMEGTGMPMVPTANGIVYTNEPALLTNTASLGTFTNAGLDGALSFPLELPESFINDLKSGGEVGLFLTAVETKTGFTFNSRSFTTTGSRPTLEISAVSPPGIANINLSGADVVLAATNGVANGTYYVLTSTNVALPLNEWLLVATNVLDTSGDFTITATNVISADVPQFFILQTQ